MFIFYIYNYILLLDTTCPPLQQIENGRFRDRSCIIYRRYYTEICYASCNEGYLISDPKGIYTCEANMQWNPPANTLTCSRK